MSDRPPDRIDHILEVVQLLDLRFTAFQARLDERCGDHQRQLNGQQEQLTDLKRRRGGNGDGGSRSSYLSGWPSRAILGLIGLATALAGTIVYLVEHHFLGGR